MPSLRRAVCAKRIAAGLDAMFRHLTPKSLRIESPIVASSSQIAPITGSNSAPLQPFRLTPTASRRAPAVSQRSMPVAVGVRPAPLTTPDAIPTLTFPDLEERNVDDTAARSIGAVPEAWPALLSRAQLCAYISMSWDSLSRICPVAPLALGVNLLRWRRADIDGWISGLPSRLPQTRDDGTEGGSPPAPPPSELAGKDRRSNALERASQRALRRTRKPSWKKT